MTKREARALVLKVMAALIDGDLGGAWIQEGDDGEDRNPKDVERIESAIKDVAAMLRRMAAR